MAVGLLPPPDQRAPPQSSSLPALPRRNYRHRDADGQHGLASSLAAWRAAWPLRRDRSGRGGYLAPDAGWSPAASAGCWLSRWRWSAGPRCRQRAW